jgi:hypothetical protein
MDDLDRLLAETMRDAAERAPGDGGLLATVHRRSGRRNRQRIAVTLSAVAAALAVGVPAVVALATRTLSSGPLPATSAGRTAETGTRPGTSAGRTARTGLPGTSPGAVVRLADGWTAPLFPYTLPASAGLRAPVASMDGGDLVGFFEAVEQLHHADTTVTVSATEPSFTGPATETAVQVRGHAGTLRTVDVRPAKRLTLVWHESAARWITLATDDTYRKQQVVGLADALTPAEVPVLPPFDLDLTPGGFTTGTVTESTMAFTSPAGDVTVVLRKHRPLTAADRTVGPYPAALTRDGGGATLDVDVTDWDATLEVTVGPGLSMSDSDLLRFADGVHILDRSNPE